MEADREHADVRALRKLADLIQAEEAACEGEERGTAKAEEGGRGSLRPPWPLVGRFDDNGEQIGRAIENPTEILYITVRYGYFLLADIV